MIHTNAHTAVINPLETPMATRGTRIHVSSARVRAEDSLHLSPKAAILKQTSQEEQKKKKNII